ncbi:MAG: sugar-binding domain-containing protein [Vicinamibacterales bacterium]
MTRRATLVALLLACLPQAVNAQSRVDAGKVSVGSAQLQPGRSIDLSGQWLYKPGYLLGATEQPQLATDRGGYVPVPVPQLLNRTLWWLDDSEDFKKFEQARLAQLGFEAERATDGWYQLQLNLPALPRQRRIFVEFEGVAMKSRTFCNGQLLGAHAGMFSRFSYDLTPHLKAGRNTLSVFVSMEKIPSSTLSLGQAVTVNLTASKILTLSKGMFGPLSPGADNRSYDLHGIWQPVKLVVRDEAIIDDAWFIPSLDGARVQVETRSLAGARSAVLKARWTDVKSNTVFVTAAPVPVTLGEQRVTRELTIRNLRPNLWTPASPHLYRLDVTLESAAGVVLDRWTHNVGFRTFEVRGNRLFLNGQPYWLRGANQLPYGKNSWDPALPRVLIQLMHDGHQRVTRTHATPWNEAWLRAADEIGLGVSIEGIRPWALAGNIGVTPPDMFSHWMEEQADVIKRGRNHPSILLWTVGNEMLLREPKSLEKWQLLSEAVKQTRRLDPFRPVIADSTYQREADFYEQTLQPNGLDDGDADDIHRYRGWYADSPFVVDSHADIKNLTPNRPLIGQEMSTGYPDLDTGLPVFRYTRDLVTPQAWVGQAAYPGGDPAVFLEHNRAVTKRWAEQLRFQRGDRTAGFLLFSAETWFAHSYDARRVAPYPVYDAMRDAWAPIGLALETGRRRFQAGEIIETAVFVTNDDEAFRDRQGLTLRAAFVDTRTNKDLAVVDAGRIERLPYYVTVRQPLRLRVPDTKDARLSLTLVLRLIDAAGEVSRTSDRIDVFANVAAPATPLTPSRAAPVIDVSPTVVLVGAEAALKEVGPGGRVRALVERGGTAILFSPGKSAVDLFPADVLSARSVTGEYADFAPSAGTAITVGLRPMDIKWWGRTDDWRVFVASSAHRLKAGGAARELIRFIPAHGYIPAERVPEQYLAALFEIPVGRGRVWVCNLDLEASVAVDPAARLLAINLLRAAADGSSTKSLPVVPSHEERLAGTAKSAGQEFIALWDQGAMPNSKGMTLDERIVNERMQQVATPGMFVFFPPAQENSGAAVLICPGGGYTHLAYVVSGTELARWFASIGVSAFVLTYRLPTSPDLENRHLAPLQDAQRAMEIIRASAGRWGIRPDRIGVLGTSAGGHLAATLGTSGGATAPNFMILVSPVITMGEHGHAGSRTNLLGPAPSKTLMDRYSLEKQATPVTPPAFLVHATDDKAVSVRNSLMFYDALLAQGVSASLHVFPHGGHAIALTNNPGSTQGWTKLCQMWLAEMGFVPDSRR